MQTPRIRRTGALIVGAALVVAACSNDDEATPSTTTPSTTTPSTTTPSTTTPSTTTPSTTTAEAPADEAAPDEEAPDQGPDDQEPDDPPAEQEPTGDAGEPECEGTSDGVLTVGTILPVTGELAFLGAPEVAAAQLAVDDINAAGGVLGEDAVLHQGDSGDITTDLADQEVDRLLALGSDVIVGASSSAVSFTVIDKITRSCTIQFSSANTAPGFTAYDDDGLYFRTAPSDILQGRVLASLVLADGNATASVIFREDPYGDGLARSFTEEFEASGGTVDELLAYPVGLDSFDNEVDSLVDAGSDAIVVIGFKESAAILNAMHDDGIGPLHTAVYGVDGNISGIGGELADPSRLSGMRGTEPSVVLDDITGFTDRLDELGEMGGVYAYGAETYDAIIIAALASLVAGTDDPAAIATEINEITRPPGEQCFSFRECGVLVEADQEIDYVGIGGPYEFLDSGEPSAASYRIATYDGGPTPNSDLDEYVFVR